MISNNINNRRKIVKTAVREKERERGEGREREREGGRVSLRILVIKNLLSLFYSFK
jgi:hypothetical protein